MKHPLPDAALDDRLFFGGTAGSGKTYNAMSAVERLLARKARVVIPDPLGVWWGLRLKSDGQQPSGFDVVIFGGPHGDLPLTEHAGALIGETVAGMKESCILDLSQLGTKAAERRFMLAFLTALYRNVQGEPLHVVFDEADMWAPQRLLDKEGEAAKLLGMMETVVRRGRVKGFVPWLISQRPAVVNKDVLSQVDGIVAFKLTGTHDRDAIGDWVEGQADKAAWRPIFAQLATMSQGQGVIWIPARGILETAQFPVKQTFDSSRTPKRGETVKKAALKPLDLGALKERLSKVDAEVKANDPAALKAEIARLKGDLAKKPAGAPDPGEVNAAHERGSLEGRQHAERQYQPLLVAADIATRRLGAIIDEATEMRRQVAEAVEAVKVSPAPAPGITHARQAFTPAPTSAPAVSTSPAAKVSTDLSRPQQRILDALAWLESIGIGQADRTRAAMLADASPKSSGFEKNVSTLSSKGLIAYPVPGALKLTQAGREAANAPTTPPTNADLHAAIRSKISGPQWALLEALIRQRVPLSRAELAEQAGVSAASSGFEKNVSTLSGFGFVTYPERGYVQVADIMFVER